MSDPNVYEFETFEDETDPTTSNSERDDYLVRVKRGDIRTMEQRLKDARDTQSRAANLERENAMLKAGVDLNDPKGTLFSKGYDGDLTPDKIREAAVSFGILEASTDPDDTVTEEPPDTPLEPGEESLPDQQRELARGAAQPGETPAPDPYDAAAKIHKEALESGAQEKEAIGAAINSVVNAAHDGDQRVILGQRGPAGE